jgi:hypothetical protein
MLRTSWGQSKLLDLTLSDYIKVKKEGWQSVQDSAAPLRNMKKDFQCLSSSCPSSSPPPSPGAASLPLTYNAGALISEACDKSSWNLQDHAFVALLKLLPRPRT